MRSEYADLDATLNDFLIESAPDTRRRPCQIGLFQTSRYQIGSGASAIETPTTSLKLLARPLTMEEYGRFDDLGQVEERDIYATETDLLVTQAVAPIYSKGISGDKLVHIILLNEWAANGQTLNEIGLFVDNPFYKLKEIPESRPGVAPTLVSLNPGGVPSDFTDFEIPVADEVPPSLLTVEAPGSLLAAYRQFPNILKEDFFTIIFRWSIAFKPEC